MTQSGVPRETLPRRIKKARAGRPHKRPMQPSRGRPFRITAEVEVALLVHIRNGVPIGDACLLAGIGRSTYQRYIAEGKTQERGFYRELWEKIERAQAEYRAALVKDLHAASEKDPRAILAILERRDRGNWAPPKQALELDGEVKGGGAQVVIQLVSNVPRVTKPITRPATLEERRQAMLGPAPEQASG